MMVTEVSPRALNIDVASHSNRGKKRTLNEDAIFDFTTHSQTGSCAGLYVVCDGKGGRKAGDIASQLAVETVVAQMVPFISRYQAVAGQFSDSQTSEAQRCVTDAVKMANQRIHAYNQENVESQAATTLTMAFLQDQEAIVANVGDSRAYVWHEQQLTQLTDNHRLELAFGGEEPGDYQPQFTSHKSWAMGLDTTVKVDLYEWEIEAGDKLLLCSDGLWQAFADEEDLASFLYANRHASDICQQLIREANRRDGSDNISAVVICTA